LWGFDPAGGLFRRKRELGKRTEETDDVLQSGNVAADLRELGDMLVAVGGDGEGGADVRIGGEGQDSKSGKGRISLK
jgi:hypothetical protein